MRKLLRVSLWVLLGSGIAVANADESGVYISEVMWDGTEYVELYNNSGEDIELEGWALKRQKVGSDEQTIITFSEDHRISAATYFLIEKNEDATSIEADVTVGSLTLVNTGETVRIYNKAGDVVDSAGGEGAWPAGKNTETGVSMERVGGSWQNSSGSLGGRSGTPKAANSGGQTESVPSSAPQSYSTSLVINEFLPNPAGEDTTGEFIELYNPSSETANLSGWQLDDAAGGSTPYTFPDGTSISGHSYAVFKSTDTKIALNNTDDSVRLIDPLGEVHVQTTYSGGPENQSYNRDSAGTYKLSTTITAGSANDIVQPTTPTPKPSPTVATTPTPTKTTTSPTPTTSSGAASGAVIIWRIMPDPIGKDEDGEYIEIKSNDSKAVSLVGWSLDDEDGGSTPYVIPDGTHITPGQILSFPREETDIALNNTGDTVRLLSPAGAIVDEITYGNVQEGEVITAGVVAGATTEEEPVVASNTPTASSGETLPEPQERGEEPEAEQAPEIQVALAGGAQYGENAMMGEEDGEQSRRDGVLAGTLLVGGALAAAVAYAKPGALKRVKSYFIHS